MVNRKKRDISYLLFFIAGILVLNIVSYYYFTRFDFTAEKRYTLNPLTRDVLQNINDPMQITVYLEGDFPAGFKHLRNETRDLLTGYRSYAGGTINVDFVNPSEGNPQQQQEMFQRLSEQGVPSTNLSVKTEEGLSQKIVFPGAIITYNGRQIPVNLFQNRTGAAPEQVLNNSIQNLEYAFTGAIKKLISGGKPRIGFSESNGELNDLQLNDAIRTLEDGFEVGRVDLRTIPLAGMDKLKLLVIAKPSTAFTEAEKYKINHFILNGGSVLWAVDNVNAELDSLRGMGSQLAFPKKLEIDDMLFRYGVRINYDLIADMNCAQIPVSVGNVGGQAQIQMLPWLFYPVFVPVSGHPVVKNLDGIRSEFASSIDTIAAKGIRKEVILSSSPYSRLMTTPNMISLQMVEQEPDPQDFRSKPKPFAVILEGSFPNTFMNRPLPEGIQAATVLPDKSKPAKMLVVADGDVFKNQISATDGSAFPLGYDRYSQQQYGNKNFLLNAVDYLTDDSGIISLRNKEVQLRLLDRARIREEKTLWQAVNLLLPLVLLAIAGIFQHYYRRKKYAA